MSTPIELRGPRVIAIARDTYLRPRTPFPDPINLPGVAPPLYGPDIDSSTGRKPPGAYDVGKTAAELVPKMRKLVSVFAKNDRSGMASRLVEAFLARAPAVQFFEDPDLNRAAAEHENIRSFCTHALGAPNIPGPGNGKLRIHQALRNAGWDIHKIVMPTDLGVPAFNDGSKLKSSGDYGNGLGLMINGVQYAYCVATRYRYDPDAKTYAITIRYVFYDVFGLDDDDLKEFAENIPRWFDSVIGIVAWWQLQHQHGYNPLVTRCVVDRTFEAPAV